MTTIYTNEEIDAHLAKLRDHVSYPEEKQAAEMIEQLRAERDEFRRQSVNMAEVEIPNWKAACAQERATLLRAEQRVAKLRAVMSRIENSGGELADWARDANEADDTAAQARRSRSIMNDNREKIAVEMDYWRDWMLKRVAETRGRDTLLPEETIICAILAGGSALVGVIESLP